MTDSVLIQPTLFQVPLNKLANDTLDLLSTYAEKIGMFGLTRDDVVPPVAMLSIAQSVINEGYSVSIIDMYLEEVLGKNPIKLLYSSIKRENPRIAGIANMETCTLDASIEVARKVKEINKDICIVFGGVSATAMDAYLLENYPFIDIIVRGEGEKVFSEIVSNKMKNRSLSNIKGITYRKNNYIKRNDSAFFLKPDKIPIPNREIYPLDKLYNVNFNTDMIYASRGCPFNCSFCNGPSFWKREWRGREIEKIIEEMKTIEELGAKNFHMWDLNFGVNKKWVVEICKRIKKEGINLKWEVELRLDNLSEDFVKEITNAGCVTAYCGIESRNQNVLNSVNKSYNLSIQNKALNTAKKHGLKIEGGYVIGLPEDTEKSITETTKMATSLLKDDLAVPLFFIFVPFPGTDIGDNPDKYNIKIINNDFRDYHFIPKHPLASTKFLSGQEVFDLWEKGTKSIRDIVRSKIDEI